MATTRLHDNNTILFIGDSITDCGRRDPQHQPLGCGYVRLFADMLAVREPQKHVTVLNTGIGGNTVDDLRSRWVDDALSLQPDWLSVKIGINDCNRHLANPDANPRQSPEAFEAIYDQVLKVTRDSLPGTKLLLIDPFYGSLDVQGAVADSFRATVHETLPAYIAAVDRMGVKYDTLRVKTHDLFHARFPHQHPSVYFPNEPVHPNAAGHLLIAEAVYDILTVD